MKDTIVLTFKNNEKHLLTDFKYIVRPHITMLSKNWGCGFYDLKVDGVTENASIASFNKTKKMRNYRIYIFLIILLISCKKSITTCNNANLNKTITILGFPRTLVKNFNASFYEIKEGVTPRKIIIKKIYFSNDEHNYLNIELDEDLFANNTYKLNLNDTLRYKISEIKTFSEVRMIGSRKDSVCKTKSFKVNDKIAETFFTTGINFKKPK